MKKRLQGLIAGVLIGAMLASGMVFAKQISETIEAIYMNVKLVIDGEEFTPKDVNGNIIEPFIYNGTTYLPVRAIGEAFDKDVHWDEETATVYVGDIVKPTKEVYLYDKPYLECDIPSEFKSGKSDDISNQYIGFNLGTRERVGDYFEYHNSVTYALNGLAKKVKGTFVAPMFPKNFAEYRVNFYNESGKLLYQSPIMTKSISPIDFEFDTGNSLKIKAEINGRTSRWHGNFYCIIKDFAILTTDY